MRAWMANLAGVLSAGTALIAGVVLGAPEAEANAPSQPLQLSTVTAPGQDEVALGDSMVLHGQPARLSMFWTTDSMETVVSTYMNAWQGGPHPPVIQNRGKMVSVAAMESSGDLLRSVMVQDLGDVRMVVPSLTDVRQLPDLSGDDSPLPLPENARGYLSQVADDSTTLSHHASYYAKMSAETAVEFYKVELGKLGYQTANSGGLGNNTKVRSATFSRGPELVNVVATPPEPGTDASFIVVDHTRTVEVAP
jgi:hypothetical protein